MRKWIMAKINMSEIIIAKSKWLNIYGKINNG